MMHLWHKWPRVWDKPVLIWRGLEPKLPQRRECKICGLVQYRKVTIDGKSIYSNDVDP